MEKSEIIFRTNKNGQKTAYQRSNASFRQQRIGMVEAELLIATDQARVSTYWS